MRKKDINKIENIKKAVIKLIFQQGLRDTSVSRIAKEAGVSPATIYIYYENKDRMIEKLYNEVRTDMYDYILTKLNFNENSKRTFKEFCELYYKYIIEHEQEFYFIKQYAVCPVLSGKDYDHESLIKLDEWLIKIKGQGIIKNVCNRTVLSLILLPIEGLADHFLKGRITFSQDDLDQIFEMLWDAIVL